jgi:hypothetical protein
VVSTLVASTDASADAFPGPSAEVKGSCFTHSLMRAMHYQHKSHSLT